MRFMNNLNIVRGIFLIAIALLFGVAASQYQVGVFSKSGPGLFPLLVSAMLFVLGLVTLVRARFVPPVALNYSVKNIAVILMSLCGFVVLSEYLNMLLAIVFLVFFSTLAGTDYSIARNLKITVALVAVAMVFKYLLNLNLPLI